MEEKDIEMTKNEDQKKHFSDKNHIIRIISLLCAVLLWFYVSEVESPSSEKTFDSISITLKNKDVLLSETDLSLVSEALYETDVVLSGKKSVLNKIDYEDIVATVDLSKLNAVGTYELSVSVVAPTGTSVVSTNPRYITVSVDKTVAKIFNIETEISYSNLPSTYELGDCVITDSQSKVINTVTISGPETEIEKIDRVVAEVDFGSVESSVEAKTNLVLYDYYGEEIPTSLVRVHTPSVKVLLPVYVYKTLTLTTSQAYDTFTDSQISFKIRPATVDVKGDPKLLEKMTTLPLDPINERTIGESLVATVNSLIKLPEGIELVVSENNTATITASVKGVKTEKVDVSADNIKVTGLSSSLKVKFRNDEATLIFINSSNKPISKDDFELPLDLSVYTTEGSYTLKIEPVFKSGIGYAYSLAPYSLTFELVEKEGV